MVIPCNPGTLHWNDGIGHGGSFRPNGKIIVVPLGKAKTMVPNPYAFESYAKVLAARLFVGFNVGGKKRWTMDDVIRIVRSVRKAQDRSPDSSFIAQKGIYTSSATGKMVVEDGAQIIIIEMAGDSMRDFRKQMEELAETIARRLKQELVILEMQKAGQSVVTIGMRP